MPREQKKRGKRADKKRKLDEVPEDESQEAKRSRLDGHVQQDVMAGNADFEPLEESTTLETSQLQIADKPFYGMLDEDEQEFFKKADDTLELDAFADEDEKAAFLQSVFKEAEGKELKMACSQSCSRVLERLIQASSTSHVVKVFQNFNSHFLNLLQHRFASHCCEKLFQRAAPIVTDQLLGKSQPEIGPDDIYAPMETLFLHTVAELEGNIGFLITDKFASHPLRLLLLILAGEPLTGSVQKSVLQSKRKENIVINGASPDGESRLDKQRPVPKSFNEALEKLMADCIDGLHTQGLRQLAVHPIGSPILQVLIRLELSHFGKDRARDPKSVLRTLLPEDPISQDTGSAGFINGLNYDPVGSHLLEVIIQFTPGKMFKHLYKEFWKDRMASLSRSEVAAYVVCKILERIGKDDLIDAHEAIVPTIPDLIDRNRIVVIKTLIERCRAREVDTQAIAVAFDAHFREEDDGFDILKLLRLSRQELEERFAHRIQPKATKEEKENHHNHATSEAARKPLDGLPPAVHASREPDAVKVQGAVLTQAMIQVPGPLSGLIFEAMAKLPPHILIAMALDPIASRTLQATMTSTNAFIIPRRKLVQQFYGHIGEMALDPSASHVVDAIWEGTHGLAFIRERIAEELAENEASLRDSPCGRAVWKNWKMDLYKRRRNEWVMQSRNKASNDGFQSFEELEKNKRKVNGDGKAKELTDIDRNMGGQEEKGDGRKKTPLEKARERHAKKKQATRAAMARASERGHGPVASGSGTVNTTTA